MTEVSLFESDLLSPEVQSLLPPGYTLRALRSNDYERGFLKVLEVLTEVGNHSRQEFDGKKKKKIVVSAVMYTKPVFFFFCV